MKKTVCLLLAIIALMIFSIPSYAESSDHTNTIEYNGRTIIFEENSQFTDEEQQYIAQFIVDGDPGLMPLGLSCTLFGHKDVTEIVKTIEHCVYSTDPRCIQDTYRVTTCSKCHRVEKTLLSQIPISCCP